MRIFNERPHITAEQIAAIKTKALMRAVLVVMVAAFAPAVLGQEPEGDNVGDVLMEEKMAQLVEYLGGDYRNTDGAEKQGDIDSIYKLFPLRGKKWLFGKGYNGNVYATFSKSIPTHAVQVEFPLETNGDFVVNYAVLSGLYYKSTGHLINEIEAQFRQNEIRLKYSVWKDKYEKGEDTLLAIAYKNAPDTLWSCDRDIAIYDSTNDSTNNYTISEWGMYWKTVVNDVKSDSGRYHPDWRSIVGYKEDWDGWVWGRKGYIEKKGYWHKEKGTAAAKFPFAGRARENFTKLAVSNRVVGADRVVQDSFYYKPGVEPSEIGVDRCERKASEGASGWNCYEYFVCNSQPRVSALKFWQLHLFPLVKYFPRDLSTGDPIYGPNQEYAMSASEAVEARNKSLELASINVDVRDMGMVYRNVDTAAVTPLLYTQYRNPFFSDSLSCVMSAQFVHNGDAVPDYFETNIEYSEPGFDDFFIGRFPNRIVEVTSTLDEAVLRLYAATDYEDSLARGMASRCGLSWRADDVAVGETYRFPNTAHYQVAERAASKFESFRDYLYAMVRRIVEMLSNPVYKAAVKRGVPDELAMDTNYIEKRYIYNFCPCLPIAEFNVYENGQVVDYFTLSDLRTYIYKTPPMCDEISMANALAVLLMIARQDKLTSANMVMLWRRVAMLGDALGRRSDLNAQLSDIQKKQALQFCADTWEINFRDANGRPRFASSYTPDMKNRVERIKSYLAFLDKLDNL
jgi:hypothetical protein